MRQRGRAVFSFRQTCPQNRDTISKRDSCQNRRARFVASVFFGSGELLNDPWTLSNKGERRLTLLSFHQVLTLRKPAFAEASFKLS